MDYSHEAIACLEGGNNVVTYGDPEGKVKTDTAKQLAHFKWLAQGIRLSQKFDFTGIQKTFNHELFCTAGEALFHDLITVPFDHSFFTFQAPHQPELLACALISSFEASHAKSFFPDPNAGGLYIEILARAMTPFHGSPSGTWIVQGLHAIVQKGENDEGGFRMLPCGTDGMCWGEHNSQDMTGPAKVICELVLQALVCLEAKGIKLETITPPRVLNKIRRSKGKPPLAEHKIVVIDPAHIERERSNGSGTHASPRLHWRRGHIRTLPSGKKTAVRACIVGDPAAGWVEHDYEVITS